jgi:nitric oxide reductase subunit C
MLSKSQAKIFFLGGTGVFSAAFLSLTFDTHRKVPSQTNADKITPAVTRGKRIWEDNNCMGCHTLFGEGAYYAPELTKVVERRGKPWMRLFLKNPEAMFPNERKMVNYHFTDEQIEDLIAFFEWCGNVDLNGFPAKPPLAAKMVASSAAPVVTTKAVPPIFETMGCLGCHALGGKGGAAGSTPSPSKNKPPNSSPRCSLKAATTSSPPPPASPTRCATSSRDCWRMGDS